MGIADTNVAIDHLNPLRSLTLAQLRQRASMKWQTYPPDVLPLWVAEMDVPLAEPVVRAVMDAVTLGDTGYPAGTAYSEALTDFGSASGTAYADALSRFAHSRWNWDNFAVERTMVVPDVMLGVTEVLKAITGYGDAVVINCPVYPPFYSFVANSDRRIVEAPLGSDLRLNFGALENAFSRASAGGRRAAYLLCSPHNPTGTVHTAEELTSVATMADRYGVRVVVDEVHAPLVTAGTDFVPFLSLPQAQRGFSLMSASKGWHLAGLRAALAVAGEDATDDFSRIPEETTHGASHIGIIAHTAAFRHCGDWLDALLDGIAENRRLLAGLLAEHLPAVHYQPGPGTYLAWLDCRALRLGEDPATVFLKNGGVALNSGREFGTGGEGYARMNLATSPDLITEAVRRMAKAVA